MASSARYLDLQRQGFMRGTRSKKERVPKPSGACELCLDWHEEGKHRFYVWTVDERDAPIDRKVAIDRKTAAEMAESRARFQNVVTAISRGADPDNKGFKIVATYEAGSGEKMS